MGLKIGQVSSMLNLSAETLRFYESEGVVSPKRIDGSTYRIYDMWDVFRLIECMKYRGMGFSLKSIKELVETDTLEMIDERISAQYRMIERNIEQQHLLIRYMADLHRRIAEAKYNVNNYWIRRQDERIYLPCCERKDDAYTDFDYKSETLRRWFSCAPFFSAILHTDLESIRSGVNHDRWSLVMDKDYFELMRLPLTEEAQLLPAQMYVHTIIDMGEKGTMDIRQLRPALDYVESHGFEITGEILGEILVRLYEKGRWHRYMEVMIQIKS